jgi:hypothetical protein
MSSRSRTKFRLRSMFSLPEEKSQKFEPFSSSQNGIHDSLVFGRSILRTLPMGQVLTPKPQRKGGRLSHPYRGRVGGFAVTHRYIVGPKGRYIHAIVISDGISLFLCDGL